MFFSDIITHMNPFIHDGVYSISLLVLVPLILWTLFWKISALWVAAQANHKKWFIALSIINTFGILEIIYIFKVSKRGWSNAKGVFTNIKN